MVYLIPGVVKQLLLLLHERRLLGEEAHADRLDVLQVLHVDVLHLWQHKPLLFFFLSFLSLDSRPNVHLCKNLSQSVSGIL